MPGRAPGGLPHSEIPGSQAASASPGHFAAWPRPSSAANAKASTMRPSCGFLLLCPSSRRRCGNSRPARASGTCRAWLDPSPMSRTRRVPDRRVLCNDVSVQCARATPHEPHPPPIPVRWQAPQVASPRVGLACSRGRRTPRVPRGALSRYREGFTPPHRRVSPLPEVVKPRPKPSADLGRGLPTISRSRQPRLAHPNWRRTGAFPPGVERP